MPGGTATRWTGPAPATSPASNSPWPHEHQLTTRVPVKLAEWAHVNRVHPQTAYRWFREDRMPVPARRLASGTIWVDAAMVGEPGRVVVYARVSSHDQRADLDRQVARVTGWATSNGHRGSEVACEVGSGINGNRP